VPAPAVTDCSGSTMTVFGSGDLDGIIEAKTDPTSTSLLVTNVSELTLIVVPGVDGATRLQPTPGLNPDDNGNVLAFEALLSSNVFVDDPNIPTNVPLDQVYVVPPNYSVCGISSGTGAPASMQVQRDRLASGAWRVSYALAEKLVGLFTPGAIRSAKTISNCLTGAVGILRGNASLTDVEFYETALSTASTCYSSVSGLFQSTGQPAVEAQQTRAVVLKGLKRLPQLIDDARFLFQLATR
jgi:hypothetical protein